MTVKVQIALSEISPDLGLKVIRDGKFSNLGFISNQNEESLVFASAESAFDQPAFLKKVSAIITLPGLENHAPEHCAVAVSDDPYGAFLRLHEFLGTETDFYYKEHDTVVHPSAEIHPTATLPEKNVRIGANTVVGANVVIWERSVIAEDIYIAPNVVIGEGSVDHKKYNGAIYRVPHQGGVSLARGVEIQVGAIVSRNTFGGQMPIEEDTCIGAQAFIAHNCSIGRRCNIGVGALVAGNVHIGNDVRIAPHAAINVDLAIGDEAFVEMGQLLTRDLPSQHVLFGQKIMTRDRYESLIKAFKGPSHV